MKIEQRKKEKKRTKIVQNCEVGEQSAQVKILKDFGLQILVDMINIEVKF